QRASGGDGTNTSRFTVPGAAVNTVWVFDNGTGVITSICTASNPCVASDRFLLAGFVRFATDDAPSAAEAENPTDLAPGHLVLGTPASATTPPTPATPALTIEVQLSQPAGVVETCYTQSIPGSSILAYYCAVPTRPGTPPTPGGPPAPSYWSGQIFFSSPLISTTLADDDASHFKVCRYTPGATHTPPGGNSANPLTYSNVTGALMKKNFLMISAGNRGVPGVTSPVAFTCPTDDTTTPLINGNTFPHQPTA
ncbi:MAG TPA: hypothetical protein VEZ89_09500, partial [Rubrivivax sp.]|nr:hypothetical protein [Rubrivivax sp.]